MKIKYYAADGYMSDTSPADCEKYRVWAKARIASEYPDAEVDVVNGEGNNVADTGTWAGNDENALEFLASLWDACPWDWV